MAAGKRTTYRRQSNTGNRSGQFYVYGNVAHQPKVLPNQEKQAVEVRPKKRTSSQVKKNRRRALDMSPIYTGFLTVAAVCAVFICVVYLQLQSELVQRSENITALQEELSDLTEANDTAYNAAADSVNLQEIRDKAMNELGMVYAANGNVVEYDSQDDFPETGEDGKIYIAKDTNLTYRWSGSQYVEISPSIALG